ncbi:hypothetical protein YC2023_018567 [Brassica napus]
MASPPPFPFIFTSFCSFLNSHGSFEGGDKGVEEVKISEEETEEEFEVKECTNDESHVHVDTRTPVYMWPSASGVHVAIGFRWIDD